MEPSAMESIAARLSTVDNLYFPGSIHSPGPPPPSRLKSLLLDLLSRDPPLFLERYGSHLTPPELRPFETLAPRTYELDFHLSRLKTSHVPTAAATVKNRRRAYLERLVEGGDYFSEEAMREREPWLHYDLVGRFQDPAGRGVARPGERWSETLMRRWEEAEMAERIRGEQQRLGVDKKDWVGGGVEEVEMEEEQEQMEEVETETETGSEEETNDDDDDNIGEGPSTLPKEDEDHESNGDAHGTATKPFEPSISEEEMQDQMDQFTHIMQQKFLAGEDTEHLDYSKIDNDERLDDHWVKEANHDAEEKYFDED